ncbi:ABC transporter ATP-binding protein [Liquorilactobacillus cacaonum]|nr:ABC transporter ATP-binding protein [Liquorilactobacillus cacaonum]
MNYIIKHLLIYFGQHKSRYIIVFVFMVFASLLAVSPTYIIRLIIDAIVQKNLSTNSLIEFMLSFALIIILSYLTEAIWTFFLFTGSYDLQKELRTNLMTHFLKMGAPFFHRFKTGDLITRSTDDVNVMGMTVGYGLMVFLNTSLYLTFIILMMIVTVSWKLTLFALLPMPILAYFIFKWGTQVDAKFTEAQNSVSEMNSEVLEIVDGQRVVRAFGLEDEMTKKFEDKVLKSRIQNDIVSELDSRFMPLITIVLAISYIFSFGLGSYLVAQQQISIGAMISFQVYLTMIVWPMISAGDLVNTMQQGAASWRRINQVLQASDNLELPSNCELQHIESINFSDFHFSYEHNGRQILDGINLSIKSGQVIGIVGKTGSGKTTLLRQLGHRYPYSNELPFINGNTITSYRTFDLRAKIAEVPQEHTLFSRTIRENLLFGDSNATDNQLWQALKMACLDDDIKRMKDGLDTLVGEKGISLSGGQKQRLSLARAFLRKSEVLILDDALSAVDAKTEQTIIDNLKSKITTKISLIVSHRLSAVSAADLIIVLDEGKVTQSGSHQALIHKPGWYQEQYHHQQIKEARKFDNHH